MSNPTYRLTEIVGTSDKSTDDAIRNGIAKASQTVRNIDWFEVGQVRGTVQDGDVGSFQVTMKLGFRVED
ncbi:MAG: dodecin domain-containing protein [Dehalococcoidia bacterium]|nr:dodecin domain-containing protein [Dehalococcoidia bacterium]MCA9844411.1 dodecin domain-containing protein [Dehalococcoidia bacterium]MCA9852787.1 dodecin domain-containing protein [Dehalococcoidia bacterium]